MIAAQINDLERVSAGVFVPSGTWEREGWFALVSGLPNRRANAAYPLTDVAHPDEAIRDAADFFVQQHRPVLFKLTSGTPDSARSALESSDYSGVYGADVLTRPLIGFSAPSDEVEIDDRISSRWVSVLATDHVVDPDVVVEAYQAPGSLVGAARIGDEAIGLGVVRDGWLGVFSMVTVPKSRRSGKAGAILDALLAWGSAQGATSAYLQVVAENLPAQRLYTGRGFEFAYTYEYWMRPAVA